MNNKNLNKFEEELIGLIDDEFEAYLDECDLDEDRWINEDHFAEHAKESIEQIHGTDKFDDFNIESYALDHAQSRYRDVITAKQ